jgi:hypothetical protein
MGTVEGRERAGWGATGATGVDAANENALPPEGIFDGWKILSTCGKFPRNWEISATYVADTGAKGAEEGGAG